MNPPYIKVQDLSPELEHFSNQPVITLQNRLVDIYYILY